jgi:hypothetical protein
MIINKQLTRLDKGTLSTGSIIDFDTFFIPNKMIVKYILTHWFSQAAKDAPESEGWKPVSGVKDFEYKITRNCTAEEWALLNDAGAADLTEQWLKEILNEKLGGGSNIE